MAPSTNVAFAPIRSSRSSGPRIALQIRSWTALIELREAHLEGNELQAPRLGQLSITRVHYVPRPSATLTMARFKMSGGGVQPTAPTT
jgi:hypothetical protein